MRHVASSAVIDVVHKRCISFTSGKVLSATGTAVKKTA